MKDDVDTFDIHALVGAFTADCKALEEELHEAVAEYRAATDTAKINDIKSRLSQKHD